MSPEQKARRLEYQKRWYVINRERELAKHKIYYSAHKAQALTASRAYYAKQENKIKRRGYLSKWRALNRQKNAEHSRKDYRDKRIRVFALFGDRCKKCGFEDARALQVDHINGTIFKGPDRAKNREVATPLYRAILRGERRLEDYQLLCANCNVIKMYENNERGDYKKCRIQAPPSAGPIPELFPANSSGQNGSAQKR